MRYASVQHVRTVDTAADGAQARLHLGHHAVRQARQHRLELRSAQLADDIGSGRIVRVKPFHVGQHDKLLGPPRAGEAPRGRVRIEVVDAAIVGAGHAADDWYPSVIEQPADDARLDVHDVANETDVHFLAVDDGGSPLRGEQPCVFARDADRERSVLVEQSDDLALHLTDKNHPYDVHRLRCRDAQTAGEDLVHTEPVEMGVDLGAAAMDDDHANTGVAKEDHVLGERPAQYLFAHSVPAVLDHDSAAVET